MEPVIEQPHCRYFPQRLFLSLSPPAAFIPIPTPKMALLPFSVFSSIPLFPPLSLLFSFSAPAVFSKASDTFLTFLPFPPDFDSGPPDIMLPITSIGSGKTIVWFFSELMEYRVWKKGNALITLKVMSKWEDQTDLTESSPAERGDWSQMHPANCLIVVFPANIVCSGLSLITRISHEVSFQEN